MRAPNITLVTSLLDLGRGDLKSGFSRSFDHYLECFSKLLNVEFPMVIFCDSDVEEFVWNYRKKENTRIIRKTKEDLKEFPFFDNVQKIRTDKSWIDQSSWIEDSTQATLEYYNPLVMSKQFFLNDASLFDFFNTKYFLWVDAGIANTLDVADTFDSTFERRITPYLNKMLYLCFPYDGQVEVHGFKKSEMNRLAGADTQWVARGGIFGGSKHSINDINSIYYSLLNDTITSGYMGTEESIFTLITYLHKDKCNVQMIGSDGLVYKFFETIKKIKLPPEESGELAIYVLTYNIPKQFKLWAESFKTAYPKEFNSYKKYVINNSNDKSVKKEYEKLFNEYDFTEFKFDNIGICGGRHFAAEHFDKSNHELMIFFEDDMLLHDNKGTVCKSGFLTYQSDLFDKAIDILNNEKLDYLKLSFSEFYGCNHDNWAWYNVPPDKKDAYFPERDGTSQKKVKIEYTGTHRGLPFAVGEYHYCNWPLLFTKNGNKVLFLETVFEYKYEQTWMSLAMDLIRQQKLKAGTLLASPINHHRRYHYDGKKRRENEHYKN